MTVDLDRIVHDLRRLGLAAGDHVLVHSSLSRIGNVEGGAPTVICALRAAVGPEGTVLFPALSGRADLSPENPPDFDARNTPAIGIGVIPETARLSPGAKRSLNPTHSVVAFGPKAAWFTMGHEQCETPCGPGSPYDKLTQVGGRILLLGCDHNSNTSLHMIEELAGVAYHMIPGSAEFEILDLQGDRLTIRARFHSWASARNFNVIEPVLVEKGVQVNGTVGLAEARLIDAKAMRDLVLEMLVADPTCLLA
jgi:aminoglycoside 3-N-acetyltransferase